MRTSRLLASAAFIAVLLVGQAAHAETTITHKLDLTAGETKTRDGTARVGANLNYNGLIDDSSARSCTTTSPGQWNYDPRTMCEYALVSLTNPVPAADADGKVNKTVTITLDSFSPESPLSDFALAVYSTDSSGSFRGEEVGFSDNSDVPDPDEVVSFSVTTTIEAPTVYYLVEVGYFSTLNGSYKGTVKF